MLKIILAVVLLTIMYLFGMSKLDVIRLSDLASFSSSSVVYSSKSSSSSSSDLMVQIELTGSIKKPGKYKIKVNSYLEELLELSGGVSDNADFECYDLNYLIDGSETTIYIPFLKEKDAPKVSINQANISDLDELPKIGIATAQKIINFRVANGDFKKLEDLMKVDGIGNATFSALKDYIKL